MAEIQKISHEEKAKHIKMMTALVKKYCEKENIKHPNDSGLVLAVFSQLCVDEGMSREEYGMMASYALLGIDSD